MRGIWSNLKVSALKKLLNSLRVDVVFIQESKKDIFSDDEVCNLWYDDVFKFRYSEDEGGFPFFLANVYAPCIGSEQKVLWKIILNLKNGSQGKWINEGDSNAVRSDGNEEMGTLDIRQNESGKNKEKLGIQPEIGKKMMKEEDSRSVM
ncbi:hypothetical protein V6N13_097485 [Hibiscus sabdariffa]